MLLSHDPLVMSTLSVAHIDHQLMESRFEIISELPPVRFRQRISFGPSSELAARFPTMD